MAIAAIACTREAAPETAQEGTFVTTSFSVALPVEDMDTKAVALEKELLFVVFDNEGKVIEDMMQTVPVRLDVTILVIKMNRMVQLLSLCLPEMLPWNRILPKKALIEWKQYNHFLYL